MEEILWEVSILVTHYAQEFVRKYKKDLMKNKRAVRRLKTIFEPVKRILSSFRRSALKSMHYWMRIDFRTSIPYACFEELNHLFKNTLVPVEKVLYNTKMDKIKIHDTVLVGG